MPLLSLVADAAPIAHAPDSAASVGWLVLTIAAAATALNQVLGLVRNFKGIQAPDPSLPSADRVKALEERVRTVEIQMATHMGSIDSKFAALSQTLTNLQSDWNYALGKIDGRSEQSHQQG